ncbi:hypothetical protein [Methylobacter sp. BlB1]|uniref:hypothetical protein n=1 Tax=Methylobacter sp. BlB1 TaxID=2785914 RepID=UPI001892ED25|nr:hypothetical protein [Methylobacter sp. BlB1]MBF6651210.1 hypothetical protein [Methylobacter sp. BlB1]
MKNRMIITGLCIQLIGCASLKYPGWEQVKFEETVYKKPCKYVTEELCSAPSEGCPEWQKKRAIVYGANTVVRTSNSSHTSMGEYFYCASDLPPFIARPKSIWLVRNKFNPMATKLDFDKTVAKCNYETSKAALNETNINNPATAFQYDTSDDPLFGLANTLSQISARRINEENTKNRIEKFKSDLKSLYNQCLEADGFISTYSSDEKSLVERNKNCPDIGNRIAPCFISEAANKISEATNK